VFVSSTVGERGELAAERRAVERAISTLRLTPVLFEAGARPHPPRELYRAYLAQSDVFVGLYWQRYGQITPGMQISGLEEEFRLAQGLPRLLYVKAPAPDREPRLARIKQPGADRAAVDRGGDRERGRRRLGGAGGRRAPGAAAGRDRRPLPARRVPAGDGLDRTHRERLRRRPAGGGAEPGAVPRPGRAFWTALAVFTLGFLDTAAGRYDHAIGHLTVGRDLGERLDNAWVGLREAVAAVRDHHGRRRDGP
jgi:hypothetical protein